jgi:DNA polymerase III subunit delta'
MNHYPEQWQALQSAWTQKRSPQSLLFVGALDRALIELVTEWMYLIFCKSHEKKSCHECIDCHMVARKEHPDIEWIKPEKSGGPIKIDQIRELQSYSYLTPQRAPHRLIIIESADRMNTAAANALLKILEEPAPHTLFLLLATQISTVLPTVLSRCQVMHFFSPTDDSDINFLKIAEQYAPESEQALIINQAETILEGLIAVLEKREHPCALVPQWAKLDLGVLLWFFYLVYAQVYIMRINTSHSTGIASNQLRKLADLLNPMMIFSQIDKINSLQRKLSHNMHINQSLALENLLFEVFYAS